MANRIIKQRFTSLFLRCYESVSNTRSISPCLSQARRFTSFYTEAQPLFDPSSRGTRYQNPPPPFVDLLNPDTNYRNPPPPVALSADLPDIPAPDDMLVLEGCDFNHWLIVTDHPKEGSTRQDIIDGYVKTLTSLVGSEEEARKMIYSVSTKHYYAFGVLMSEDLAMKMRDLEQVRFVLPDAYLDADKEDYGGEPFIDGEAVPYDPKYHETWLRNNPQSQGAENVHVNEKCLVEVPTNGYDI